MYVPRCSSPPGCTNSCASPTERWHGVQDERGEAAAQCCYQEDIPLEDAPKAGHAKGLSYVNRHCEEGLCSGHFACVGSSI